jgi:hypothetical protein
LNGVMKTRGTMAAGYLSLKTDPHAGRPVVHRPGGSIAPPAIHTTLSALMALSAKPKGIWKSGRRIPDVSQIGYWRDIAVNGLLSSSYHLLEHKMQRALAQKSPLVSPNRNGGDDGPRWHSTHG